MKIRCAVVAVAVLFVGMSSQAADDVPMKRGEKYVSKVPLAAMKFENVSAWNGNASYSADIDAASGGVRVNGSDQWLAAGFPTTTVLTVRKIRNDRGTGRFEVELSGDGYGTAAETFRFTNVAEAARVWPDLFVPAANASDIKAFRDAAFAALAKSTFTGPLANIPADKQIAILATAQDAKVVSIKPEMYKEKAYLGVNLGSDGYVYNTIQVKQPQRIAKALSRTVFPALKQINKTLGKCPDSMAGVKFSILTSYKNFVSEGDAGDDVIQMYVPCQSMAQFADADITSQALVNASVVIVNDNRVDVTLSE